MLLQIACIDLHAEYSVLRQFGFRNAYEEVTDGCTNAIPTANLSAVCCNSQTYTLRYNDTPAYDVWKLGPGSQQFLIDITVTQGATVKHFSFSSTSTTADFGPSISVSETNTCTTISNILTTVSSFLLSFAIGLSGID